MSAVDQMSIDCSSDLEFMTPRDSIVSSFDGQTPSDIIFSDSDYQTPREFERYHIFCDRFTDVANDLPCQSFETTTQFDFIEELFSAVRHDRLQTTESLLNDGIPVDVRDENGNSLLIIACQNGNKKIVKFLLRRGANMNLRNHKGNTPLHFCFHCMLIIIKFLLFKFNVHTF